MAFKRNSLLRAQELREQKRRVAEEKTTKLECHLAEDIRLKGNNQNVARTAVVRREREARERAAEGKQLEVLYGELTRKQHLANFEGEEVAIATELERRRTEKERHNKLVQKVREESAELRDLQEKLRAAEMNLERKLQLEEKKMIKNREQTYEAAFDELMERERQNKVAKENLEQLTRRKEYVAARKVLEEQMEEKIELQRLAQQEFENERKVIDEIVAKIHAEDVEEAQRKQLKQEETKKWVANFLDQREKLRALEAEKLAKEEEQIRSYAEEVARRQQAAAAAAQKKADDADRVFRQLAGEKEEKERQQLEMEELINRLHFEEEEEKYRLKEEEKRKKQEAMRLEMMEANEYQRALQAQRKEQERQEEEEFQRKMLEKFAEDDRVEQMNAQRRRLKMQEHKREVERLAKIKQALYEEQRSRELQEQATVIKREEEVAKIVEEERLRLLREHAARLKDFLPKGVLVRPEDLELINSIQHTG
mmetsp:Transcript_19608/g.66699  ORF Transcript_19608/g.66699 Transcript_19608/m.66699 type:complete len:483 (+) Transcript_19608:98-1546(+)